MRDPVPLFLKMCCDGLGSRYCSFLRLNLENLIDKGYEPDADFFTASLPEYDSKMRWDTIIMNPPFGSQKPGADRPFLEFAAGHCDVLYSLHLAKTNDFVLRFLEDLGFTGEVLGEFVFPIKHMFTFHQKEKMEFEVSLVRGVHSTRVKSSR